MYSHTANLTIITIQNTQFARYNLNTHKQR
uniref:Uncharacterized protein n=1 Tax=Rhizophora mucronata TaxID=61149 RepID=A0A2P2JD50_RHIMU